MTNSTPLTVTEAVAFLCDQGYTDEIELRGANVGLGIAKTKDDCFVARVAVTLEAESVIDDHVDERIRKICSPTDKVRAL